MRTGDKLIKYKYIVDMIHRAGDEHTAIVSRLFSQDKETPRSFNAILDQRITDAPEVIDDTWAFRIIVLTVGEYILRYYAPASTKQQLYRKLYALCQELAELHNIVDYKCYMELLPEPVSDDITVSLIKGLHDREGITKEDFARLHNVEARTIQNKIQSLDGNYKHKPLRIGGFAVCVPVAHFKESSHRDEVRRYYTPNTMNPLVLQLNTIQTATLLQSLHYNNQNGNYLPLDLAIDVWSQLSDYTKTRIREIFCRNDPEFTEFLEQVDSESESVAHRFMSESEILEERDTSKGEMLLIAHKGGMICDIELTSPLRSRSNQRIMYDFEQQCYYAVSADDTNGTRLYFTEDELTVISECH